MNSVEVYQILKQLNISFIRHDHPPVFTIQEANNHWSEVKGMHCKNLFLRDNKGRRHFLLCAEAHKQIDLKALGNSMGMRLGFASPKRLLQYLGLEPGSVSPFGLINDAECKVKVFLDKEIEAAEIVNFHPNINSTTLGIAPMDLKRFIEHCGNKWEYVELG